MFYKTLLIIFLLFSTAFASETQNTQKNIFITGVSGFVGFHLANKLIDNGYTVYGCDNLTPYYSPKLKKDRLDLLKAKGVHFFELDIMNIDKLNCLFEKVPFQEFVHLAAQAGVRYSMENPRVTVRANINGFFEVIELCKNFDLRLIYASSSSVYGDLSDFPQNENMKILVPNSLYSATKISNELFAHVYYRLYGLKSVGLRFFTVYGPWGRPDMAYFSFANNIINEKPITLFENGHLFRDFTYVDDIVNGIIQVINSDYSFEVFNLGKGNPDEVITLVQLLEKELGKKAKIINTPLEAV